MVKLITTLVFMASFGFAQAQNFKFSAGYGFPWVSQQIGVNTASTYATTHDAETSSQVPQITTTHKSVNGSYGAGLVLSGSFGYKLSENIGLDLGLSYILGKKYTVLTTHTDTRMGVLKSSSRDSEASQGRAVLFTPTLTFTSFRRIFTPYFMVGPVVGKINFHRELDRSTEENGVKSFEHRYTKFTGGISLGLRGGIGVNVTVNRKLSLFSEIIFTGINYYPKESEVTRYTVNGEDKLKILPESAIRTVYEKKIAIDSNKADDLVNSPKRSARFPVPMSSLATTVGVRINLR